MKTKFITLGSKIVKKTVFTHFINSKIEISENIAFQPKNYENVLHIGYDKIYGDVFKAWKNEHDNFVIYFGTKGDEFNQ